MLDTAEKMRDLSSDVRASGLDQKRTACAPSSHIKPALTNTHNLNGNNADSNTPKVDERLRLARERREANQKKLALRERGWMAREERAKQFYEKHLEERRRKLEDQRQREERRRMAVEEKRRQRLKEERERYESVVRKTMERSQKSKQKLGHCSRRLVSSSKNAKRRSLSQWELDLVRRLQTPTLSYLARSKSAECVSRGTVVHVCRRSVSCHSITSSMGKAQVHSGKASGPAAKVSIRRVSNRELVPKKHLEGQELKKQQQAETDINLKMNASSLHNVHGSARLQNRHVTVKPKGLPSLPEEEDLEPENSLSSRPQPHEKKPSKCVEQDAKQAQLESSPHQLLNQMPSASGHVDDGSPARPGAWTTDQEEATRLLAEKRRLARLQKKEDEERRIKEETEKRAREELAQRRAEERARQESHSLRLEEERQKREEEERNQAEEERARRQREQDRQQQQREEEAHQRELAENLDREQRFQKEEAERQERKKRLEQIMKRTRKAESEEKREAVSLELRPDEERLPTVAFKERRSFRSLSGLEEIQAHQQTEVI